MNLPEDNDFEGALEGIEDEDLIDLSHELSDAGKYAYAGLCAVCLHEYMSDEWDVTFRQQCLKSIMDHLQLPPQVKPAMELTMSGEMGGSADCFLEMLREETVLNGKLKVIIQDLIALAVREGEYDARWRVLIRRVSELLGAEFEEMELYEIAIIHSLTRDQKELTPEEKKAMKSRARLLKAKRWTLIGLATIGGGTLIGLTGGLAAPLIGAGVTAVVGSSAAAAALGTVSGAAILGTIFGAAGASLTGYKMKKRVGEIEEFAFGLLCPSMLTPDGILTVPQLDITIAISGWIKEDTEENFTMPWKSLHLSREQYYLRYESKYLLELGCALEYFMTMGLTMATQEALKYTVLSGLMNAVVWPASLIGLASVIDNPWGVCCRRSAQVGKQLAEVLLARDHGHRPVTLVGYSLGARVIFYCLREMCNRKDCAGIVQDAYLIGAPCSANPRQWLQFTKVVAGTITNAYCRNDWLLKFLYRTLSIPLDGVAGLQAIKVDNRKIKNIDISNVVSGHSEYPTKIDDVLREVGIRVITPDPGVHRTVSHQVISSARPVQDTNLRSSQSDGAVNLSSEMCADMVGKTMDSSDISPYLQSSTSIASAVPPVSQQSSDSLVSASSVLSTGSHQSSDSLVTESSGFPPSKYSPDSNESSISPSGELSGSPVAQNSSPNMSDPSDLPSKSKKSGFFSRKKKS